MLPAVGNPLLPPLLSLSLPLPSLADKPGSLIQAHLSLQGAEPKGYPGPRQKTTWSKPGTTPVMCPKSDPLTGTGNPH